VNAPESAPVGGANCFGATILLAAFLRLIF